MVESDLVTDQALRDADDDEFDHAAIARAVGDLASSSAAPVNIALFGPWGSGKSTFYHLMEKRIRTQNPRAQVVRYDAWKYGGRALKTNFIQEVAKQLHLKGARALDRELTLSEEQSRIRLWRWVRHNWLSIVGALITGVVAAATWVCIHAWIDARWNSNRDFTDLVPTHVGEFGIVLAGVLTTLLVGPKALESAVVKTTRPMAERDDQFARLFRDLVEKVKKQHHADRLVVFIDELDRCEADDVVATLVDLKTFLDEDDCVFVVAADRDVLEHALKAVPQAKPVRDDDPYYSTPGAFLDKIFQHQIALPPLRAHALSSFANRLVADRASGLWKELQDHGPSDVLFNDVTYILVPGHIVSPRRVKVLLNNFATNARIAQARDITWVERAREIAFLTVLETEFPQVAAALLLVPDLLTYLRDPDSAVDSMADDRQALVQALRSGGPQSPAGVMLTDTTDNEQSDRANQTLRRHLVDYLAKLKVIAALQDPRPDLLYLRVVGYGEGLTDPALGELIDLAADKDPAEVAAAFAEQTNDIKKVAAQLLLRNIAAHRGVGQANVLEAACRIIQQLPETHVRQLSHLAPEVLTLVGGTAWRRHCLPGAQFLIATQVEAAATTTTSLMGHLDATDDGDHQILEACLPALAWMDDQSAAPMHRAVADTIPNTNQVLLALLETPLVTAKRAVDALEDAIVKDFATTTGASTSTLLDEAMAALQHRNDAADLEYQILCDAYSSRNAVLLQAVHNQREPWLTPLTPHQQTLIALYAIELGDIDDWPDWLTYLHQPDQLDEEVSRCARDAANVIIKTLPTATTNHAATITPVIELVASDTHRVALFDTLIAAIPTVPWSQPTDPDGNRWLNLRTLAGLLQGTDGNRVADTVVDSLKSSISAEVPTMVPAAIPTELFATWREQTAQLPATQATDIDTHVEAITAPNLNVGLELLRVRIAARVAARARPLGPVKLLTYATATNANLMAAEWLALKPKPTSVAKVHEQITIGTRFLTPYAEALTPDDRTTLWIALEDDHGSDHHLNTIGQFGVTGAAITHMCPKILHPTQAHERKEATRRLLLARFAETPTPNEAANGESVGHREASRLAVQLIDTGVGDNIRLAARIVIHSDGTAHGTKTKLRKAFTNYGTSARGHFTAEQTATLTTLDVFVPKRKRRGRLRGIGWRRSRSW